MAFRSDAEVQQRMADQTPLTGKELTDLMPWLNQMDTNYRQRVQIEAALLNVKAIQESTAAIEGSIRSSAVTRERPNHSKKNVDCPLLTRRFYAT